FQRRKSGPRHVSAPGYSLCPSDRFRLPSHISSRIRVEHVCRERRYQAPHFRNPDVSVREVSAGGSLGPRASTGARARPLGVYFGIFTRLTVLTRLLASTKSPSFVTSVLRTMWPPPGIAQLWNFSVFGSKRTTVFGSTSDSLYQMTPLIAEMP